MTRFLRSYFHTERDALRGSLYTTLRAGHLVADKTHHIERETLAGHELVYCLRGEGSTRVAGRVHHVTAKSLYWISCWHPHQYQAHPVNPWELYWLRIEGPGLDSLASLMQIEDSPVFPNLDFAEVQPCFLEVFSILESPSPSAPAHMHASVAKLLALLYENRFKDGDYQQNIVPGALQRPLQIMRLNYAEPLRLHELSRLAGMSVSHFIRIFRHSMGTSPIDWLRRERINQAKHRLIESDEPVKEIARQCGYRDPYFFSKDFRNLVGVPPSLYRDKERGARPQAESSAKGA